MEDVFDFEVRPSISILADLEEVEILPVITKSYFESCIPYMFLQIGDSVITFRV